MGGVHTKDPDLQKITKIGNLSEGCELDVEDQEGDENDFKKYLPSEFLKRLPGIDSHNINKVMRTVKTIVELSKMEEEELKKIVGAKNAKDIRQFLDKKVEVAENEGD